MNKPYLIRSEEQDNLRIVTNLNVQNLPKPIQDMLSLATTPEEQDIILMATLAAASACLPNLFFHYGPTGKKYYGNLQCFILAAAASGKGIANQALEMARVIDEQYPMLIAGDAQDVVPEIKPLDQRTILLSSLPAEYESKQLYSEAHSQGVCVRTATRWNDF